MKIYMFRTVRLSIIRSLFTVRSTMIYVIQVCRQHMLLLTPVYKPLWHISLLSVQWINSWWWTDELSETCRVSWQNKFVKLVHLVGFISKKFVTIHGQVNVIFNQNLPECFHNDKKNSVCTFLRVKQKTFYAKRVWSLRCGWSGCSRGRCMSFTWI
jgi:hypothetical protein